MFIGTPNKSFSMLEVSRMQVVFEVRAEEERVYYIDVIEYSMNLRRVLSTWEYQ
jgi:hypothetical protein